MSQPKGGYSRRNLGDSERVVMGTLEIDVGASDSDNTKTFKKMTVDTGVFTYDELVAWFGY